MAPIFAQVPLCHNSRYCRCSCAQLAGWWGELDYLLIWRKGRFFPPLAVNADDEIVFGGQTYKRSPQSGIRGDWGVWFTNCLGFGGGGFAVLNEKRHFRGENLTIPDLPGFLGTIELGTRNKIWGADAYARLHLFGRGCLDFDLIGGFLFTYVRDDLDFHTTTGTATPIFTDSRIVCKNNFYSGLLGYMAEFRGCYWAFYSVGKVGIGTMRSQAIFSEDGVLVTEANDGSHKKCSLTVVPELLVEVQLKIFCDMWAALGYTFIYWPQVALAGEQIDLLADRFDLKRSRFWAQGLVAGLYMSF